MISDSLLKPFALALFTLTLAACGGSSDNASPGSSAIVPGGGDGDGGGGNGDGDGDSDGDVESVIPPGLADAITDTGAAINGRRVYAIDVSTLNGGVFDPTGLVIGNDAVFEITGGGPLRVANSASDGCVLEMAPGAIMAAGSNTEFVIIAQGCQINADGSAAQPITFTAMADVRGELAEDSRGVWGGLVLNGFAPINDCPEGATGGTAECTKEGEANSGIFGGDQPGDNSGVLRYVVVKYAGANVNPENQLNGIAFQGVGAGTTVDYVQVHNNLDDGIAFFGGTVNASHVVLTGNADDSLDWTDGWQGRVQWLYIEQTNSADNGIEGDNREGDEDALPRSLPAIANMSVYGNPAERALRIRRGSGLHLYNSYVVDSRRCLRIDGRSRDLPGGDLSIAGTSFSCTEMHEGDDDGAVEAYLDSVAGVSQNGGRVNPVVPDDAWFEATNYIGAIGDLNWTEGWTVAGSVSHSGQPDFGCPDGTTEASRTINGQRVCELSGTITGDILLTNNNLYELAGKVVIGNDNADPAVLSIQAGTTVYGTTRFDFLVISRGSRLLAEGTRTSPIIFSSSRDENLQGGADIDTSRGLWGGIVINGNAPINACPGGIEGGTGQCSREGEANSGTFGGADPEDNSGSLQYVVVKYAGAGVNPENQLNGIAFQGVGSGTRVDYVQVHNSLDDGIEFFGGTVNARHVVLTGHADDSLDWTDGWQGKLQYLFIDQAHDAGDNAIEADNREGDEDALPRSLPGIANMTIKGNPGERALHLRRGTGLQIYNAVIGGSENCLRIEGESLELLDSGISFDGVSFDCPTVVEGDDVAAIEALLLNSNVSRTSEAVAAADLSGDDFFDDTRFIGAIADADNDWTKGWTVAMPDAAVEFGCPAGTEEIEPLDGTTTTCRLSGTYTSDLSLTADKIYTLTGNVTIGGDNTDSAILSIAAGSYIVGDSGDDFLVISRGSRIMATGTAVNPVVMTAGLDITGTPGANDRGLWGGLVINGNAPINDCPEGARGGTDACTKEGEANSGIFGGSEPTDNSGVLNYVVVKYAGSNVDPQNQLNGISFQGVGSGTRVDYVQVHNNLDDGIEFFGGEVSARHVVLSGNADDSLDWTDGWKGNIQYLHIVQSADSADNAIEADNREGDERATPVSEPSIANMTIVGNAGERAIRLRRGTGLHLYNSVISGSANCIRVQGESGNLYFDRITHESVSYGCPTVAEGDDVARLEDFLLGSFNVTRDGSIPAAAALPDNGFFEQTNTVGSDFDSWAGDWVFGL